MRATLLRCLLLVLMLSTGALAQSTSDALLSESESHIDNIRLRMKTVQSVIATDGVVDDQLLTQRSTIEALKLDATAENKKLGGPLAEVREQLKRLGPTPQSGVLEAAPMAAQRRLLETRVSRLLAAQTQLDLISVEADQSVTRILRAQRDRFFGRIFRSDKSALNPGLWIDTWTGSSLFASRLSELFGRWWSEVKDRANFGGLLLFPLAAGFLFALWQLIKRTVKSRLGELQPGEVRQQMTALSRLLRIVAGLLAVALFVLFFNVLAGASLGLANLTTTGIEPVLVGLGGLFSPVMFNAGLIYLLCAPRRAEARLIAIDDRSARLLPILVALTTFVYALGGQLSELSSLLNLPINSTAGQTSLAAVAMIVLLGLTLIVLRRQAARGFSEGQSYYLTWFVKILPLIWVLLGVSAFALILGYISLSYFIVGNMFDTALFAVLVAVVHYLADASSDSMLNPASSIGSALRSVVGLTEKGIARVSLLFRTTIDVLLVVLAIPTIFAIWAVTWIDVSAFYSGFFNGFTVGNITLSPWGLLVACTVLGLGIALTRFITGWLSRRVLSETSMDKGVQSSITTASSYAGYIIAFALALSAAGLDFSNIAIVAGALGVGIGFGLQSIVNNFVSGLILLAERPVRVGDWVATQVGEGIVKKINVRSTEIETFDSCTVIIPNSNLITEPVRNWTHRDTVGRFGVAVTVEGKTKADVAADVLREVMRAHPKVLRYPEPQVLLSRFAPQGLEFELKGHVSDVFEAAKVSSDIRFAIAKVFESRKIKIATLGNYRDPP
jgi:potassium-dependent mechanosensitive channel